MIKKFIEDLKKTSSTAAEMLQVAVSLKRSRVYELLREIGRAKGLHPATPNYLEAQAMQTAWSDGYNQCLDDIMYFRERFLEAEFDKKPPKMSFGGLDLALFKEDLTQEEADAIRSGKPVPRATTKPKRKSTKTTGK